MVGKTCMRKGVVLLCEMFVSLLNRLLCPHIQRLEALDNKKGNGAVRMCVISPAVIGLFLLQETGRMDN